MGRAEWAHAVSGGARRAGGADAGPRRPEAGSWIAQWDERWRAERDGCWAVTDPSGAVLGRVADKAGFTPEGILRSAMRHADGWHDMHLHARVRGDP